MSDQFVCACPACEAQFMVPARSEGRKFQCKVCGTAFDAQAPASSIDPFPDHPVEANSALYEEESKRAVDFGWDHQKPGDGMEESVPNHALTSGERETTATCKPEPQRSYPLARPIPESPLFLRVDTDSLANQAESGQGTQGGYVLVERIGEGGMGVVWRAEQTSMLREVAIKSLKDAGSEFARAQFVSEALVTGYLEHPNIIPVHALGQDANGSLYLSMKIIQGGTWWNLLHPVTRAEIGRAAKLDLNDHLQILVSVCNAIAFAHSKGILHRDLKPANVMVGEFGEVLVTDWGLAVDLRLPAQPPLRVPPKASVTTPAGSPAYMAPEMAEGRGDLLSPRTDVYLLGAILCEVITGFPPHKAESRMEALIAAVHGSIPEFPDCLPRELTDVCRKALAKDPADRFETVEDFKAAIEDYLKHRESITMADKADLVAVELSRASLRLRREADNTKHRPGRRQRRELQSIYADYSKLIARYEQALELWSENKDAKQSLWAAQVAYAKTALCNGDVGLAEAQVGHLNPRITAAKELQNEVARARVAAEAQEKHSQWMKRGLFSSAAIIFLGLTVAAVWINNERNYSDERSREADRQRKEAELQRADAFRLGQEAIRQKDLALKAKEEEATHRSLAERQRIEADRQRAIAQRERDNATAMAIEAKQQQLEAERQHRRAEAALGETQRQAEIAKHAEEIAKIERDEAERQKAIADLRAKEIEHQRATVNVANYYNAIALADGRIRDGQFPQALEFLLNADADFRGWEWGFLFHRCNASLERPVKGNSAGFTLIKNMGGMLQSAGFSRSGSRMITKCGPFDKYGQGARQTIKIWDTGNGRELIGGMPGRLILQWESQIGVLAISYAGSLANWSEEQKCFSKGRGADGDCLIAAGENGKVKLSEKEVPRPQDTIPERRTTVYVFDATTGQMVPQFIVQPAVTPMDRVLIIEDEQNKVVDLQLDSKEVGRVSRYWLSPKGNMVATELRNDEVWDVTIWNARTGAIQLQGKRFVAFSSDDSLLLIGADERNAKLIDSRTGSVKLALEGHASPVVAGAVSADKSRIFTGSADGLLRVWDGVTGKELLSLKHPWGVAYTCLSPDETMLLAVSPDGSDARIWHSLPLSSIRKK